MAGNPNLVKGERPYNLTKAGVEKWLDEHPDYIRKSNVDIGDMVRRFLKEPDPRPSSKGEMRLIHMLHSLYRTASNCNNKNQVAAATALMARAFGKERAAPEDLEAIKKGGLTLVYINRSEVDPEIPVSQGGLPPPVPEFIDAECENNNGRQ